MFAEMQKNVSNNLGLERLRNLNCFFQTCNAMPIILFEPFQKGGVWEECGRSVRIASFIGHVL